MESIYSEGVPFGGLSPTDINNPKWGNSKPEKKFEFQKFVSSRVT